MAGETDVTYELRITAVESEVYSGEEPVDGHVCPGFWVYHHFEVTHELMGQVAAASPTFDLWTGAQGGQFALRWTVCAAETAAAPLPRRPGRKGLQAL